MPSAVDTISHPTRPSQDIYLEPFADDTISEISKILLPYNTFCKVGDDITSGKDHYSLDITSVQPSLNGCIFNWENDGSNYYKTTWTSGSVITVEPGMSILNNKLIELQETVVTNFAIPTSHFNVIGLPNDGTGYCGLVWYFDEEITTDGAAFGFSNSIDFDIETMNLITILKIIRSGGSTYNVTFHKEHSGFPGAKVIELPYWRNFHVRGGVIH